MTNGFDSNIEQLADAVLFEGYNLYPYRPTSVKNRLRWMFGVIYPREYAAKQTGSDNWQIQSECVVVGNGPVEVSAKVRFLHLSKVPHDTSDDWHDVVEREVTLTATLNPEHSSQKAFNFSTDDCESIRGLVEVSVKGVGATTSKLRLVIKNNTDLDAEHSGDRQKSLQKSFLATHTILSLAKGEFVSLFNPPAELADAVDDCENIGTWPVLVGNSTSRNRMLSAPIILYDYPCLAPQSPGDLFDATEIDEMLALRIQTLTDNEKEEMAAVDSRTRQLLERTEKLTPDQMLDLHGVMRPQSAVKREKSITVDGIELRPGSRVRLKPDGRADAFDLMLSGMTGTIETLEEDFEDNTYVTITVDEDPGQDLGRSASPGHRFFFRLHEIEPIASRRILIGGIGNVFRGDDGFGVAVVQRLLIRGWPESVTVTDFGIRGVDLAYALLEGYDAVILIDAIQRDREPGTLILLEPTLDAESQESGELLLEAHSLDPQRVLQWALANDAQLPYIRLVGCEPAFVGEEDDMIMGLSESVQASVDEAVSMVESIVHELLTIT